MELFEKVNTRFVSFFSLRWGSECLDLLRARQRQYSEEVKTEGFDKGIYNNFLCCVICGNEELFCVAYIELG